MLCVYQSDILEKNGVIESYHAKLNKQKVGLGVSTFVHVALISHRKGIVDSFVEQITRIPEVVECHHITGQGDFILKVVSHNITSYQKLLVEVINEIPEIDNTQSTVILSTFKDSRIMPIPEETKEDDPLNCAQWVLKHLGNDQVKYDADGNLDINLGKKKSKPIALVINCAVS